VYVTIGYCDYLVYEYHIAPALNDFRVVHLVKRKDVMQIFLMGAKGKNPQNTSMCSNGNKNIICIAQETHPCSHGSSPWVQDVWVQAQDVLPGSHWMTTLAG
jgi:hypothetical protein